MERRRLGVKYSNISVVDTSNLYKYIGNTNYTFKYGMLKLCFFIYLVYITEHYSLFIFVFILMFCN